jgi:cytochrome c
MKHILVAIAAVATYFAAPMPASADMALASAKNCMACHAVEKKLVGPSYKAIAAKYAGQSDAVDKLANKVIKGGSGVWGPVPMPANTQINEADARKLVAWILAGSK